MVFLIKNRKTEYDHHIPHLRVSSANKFHLKQKTFEFLELNFPKKIIANLKIKNGKYHDRNLLIGISLGPKIQLKQTILNFQTKFAQKRCFQSKTKNVNIIIKFNILKLD